MELEEYFQGESHETDPTQAYLDFEAQSRGLESQMELAVPDEGSHASAYYAYKRLHADNPTFSDKYHGSSRH